MRPAIPFFVWARAAHVYVKSQSSSASARIFSSLRADLLAAAIWVSLHGPPCSCCCAHAVMLMLKIAYRGRRVKGKTLDEVLTITKSDIAKHLSLPPVKLHCSMLAEDAIKAAVKDIRAKRAKAAAGAQLQSATA